MIRDGLLSGSSRGGLPPALLELQAILENATVGILFSRNRILAQANPLCAEMFGYPADEFSGLPALALYPSREAYEKLGEEAGPLLSAGQPFRTEIEMKRRDGSLFWCRVSAKAVNPQRPNEGTIWIMEDVTSDRFVMQALEQSTHELSAIFETALVGIAVLRDRLVRRCNGRLEELFGYERGELAGKSTRLWYLNEEDYLTLGASAYPDLERGNIHRREQRFRRKDGTAFWGRLSGRAFDQSEPLKGSVWILEDITERHAAEEALRQAHEELERRVAERTAELADANARLQEEVFVRQQTEQRVWHMAHHDALTGLPNRVLLHDRLEQAIAHAEREGHRVAVMLLDLDRFKSINDTLGHAVGDEFLKHVAERLRAAVRAVDSVCRLGGDEFVVVMQGLGSTDHAVIVAEKIIHALDPMVKIGSHSLRATPSIGISVYPDDGADVFTLMKNADTAMYHAKSEGRNNFQFFTPAMNEAAAHFFGLEQRLRAGLEGKQFLLHYQPLVDLKQRAVCGMEALARWNDPEQGMISPLEFIPVAEETGLILPLGEWVLFEALRQNREWQEAGRPMIPVSVNLSPRQFRQKNLVETVRNILAETGQPPRLLELEITESTLMHDADETLAKLEELAAMGIRLAIDDFGTGYSSLSYLKRFPVHKLKIDRSFVCDADKDWDDAAIVAAIINLSRSLDLETLAEGVETEGQLELLVNFGCEKFQGYYFSRPLPPAEADRLFSPPALASG